MEMNNKEVMKLCDKWANWKTREDRSELRSLGFGSPMEILLKPHIVDEHPEKRDLKAIADRFALNEAILQLDLCIQALPVKRREAIMVEHIVPYRQREKMRQWLIKRESMTLPTYRKMLYDIRARLAKQLNELM